MRRLFWMKCLALVGGVCLSTSSVSQAEDVTKLGGKPGTGLIGGVGASARSLFMTDADKGNDTEEVCRRRFRFRATYVVVPGATLSYPQYAPPVISYYTPPPSIAPAPVFSPSISYQPIGADLGALPPSAPLNLRSAPVAPPTEYTPAPAPVAKPGDTYRYDGGPSRPVPQPSERPIPPAKEGPKLGPAPGDVLPPPAPIERMISQPAANKYRFKAFGETDSKPTTPEKDKGTLLIKGEEKK